MRENEAKIAELDDSSEIKSLPKCLPLNYVVLRNNYFWR